MAADALAPYDTRTSAAMILTYVEYIGSGLTWGRILCTCVISKWSNDIKCKYIFMFPLKNLARKGLMPSFVGNAHGWVWELPFTLPDVASGNSHGDMGRPPWIACYWPTQCHEIFEISSDIFEKCNSANQKICKILNGLIITWTSCMHASPQLYVVP